MDDVNEKFIKRVVYEAIGVGPMYQPLIEDLRAKNKVSFEGEINM